LLLERGAKRDLRDSSGMTAAMIAQKAKHGEIEKLLAAGKKAAVTAE
jgi:ankyrin repeat protein